MNITASQPRASETCRTLECEVTGYSALRFTPEDVNALRKKSHELPGDLGNSLLRHTDEQTLAALAAVKDATQQFPQSTPDYRDWGVVCSSRYLGRTAFAQSLVKFAAEGPWNVSVQVVPNRSLHSPASMVGLALGCHGPCVGVGGGLDGETDAWITATSLLESPSVAGMWMIFCGWEPDELIDTEGDALRESFCSALVVALRPLTESSGKARMRIRYDAAAPTDLAVPAKKTALSRFDALRSGTTKPLVAMLGGGLRVEWDALPVPMLTTIPLPMGSSEEKKKAA